MQGGGKIHSLEGMDTATYPGSDLFAVWAPAPEEVRLRVGVEDSAVYPMAKRAGDWWVCSEPGVTKEPGLRYGFELLIDGEWSPTFPDPRTRAQPDGIHGLSEVVTEDFAWTDEAWTGRTLESMVIYELHVGTFTPEGTFDAVIDKLDHLSDLGVTALELMPVNPFGGERNWGYDGVDWLAVQHSYGGPEGLKRLVDACHNRGIAVILDVVYNHFGPDGNYNGLYGPYTAGGSTGWGETVNLSNHQSDEVRAYVLDSVRQWLGEFHIDGLRLDAVHSYDDRGAYSIMEQMRAVADDVQGRTGIPKTLIAESDLNDPRLLTDRAGGGYGLDGQWVDDIHHALHTLVSGEDHAYYEDFGSLEALLKALREGWFFTGTYSSYRGRTHGREINKEHVPAWKLVTYTTTHDQTGNRAAGDRPSMNLSPEQQVLKAAVIYCSPFTPMLFMGEEFGATTPFPFFCSHTDEHLNEATREGRRREFAHSGWDDHEVPDPASEATYSSAKLDWNFDADQQRILEGYTTLLRLRRELQLARPDLRELTVDGGGDEMAPWLAMGNDEHLLLANLSGRTAHVPYGGQLVYSFTDPQVGDEATELAPWEFALVKRS